MNCIHKVYRIDVKTEKILCVVLDKIFDSEEDARTYVLDMNNGVNGVYEYSKTENDNIEQNVEWWNIERYIVGYPDIHKIRAKL